MDCIDRRNGGIAPTVIKNQLSAVIFESPQVGIGRIQDRTQFVVGRLHIAVYFECPVIPCRLLINQVLEELRTESKLHAPARRPP